MANIKSQALNMKIAGPTTPMVANRAPAKVAPKLTTPPLKTPGVGSNAQTQAMQNAISKTNKVQKTYGIPGAK